MTGDLKKDLNIHIIGAGMGGMGTALALAKQGFDQIHVWESAPALGEVGAGINLPPNLARILDHWGVLHIAQAEGVLLTKAHVLDCATDTILSTTDYSSYMEQTYGFPFITVHRAALQRALIKGAEATGKVQLHLGNFISEYDLPNTRFRVKGADGSSPEWVQADVILAADGVKSKARAAMCELKGEVDEVEDTGQAAYRIMVRRSAIKEDPELVPLFESTESNRWIGARRHIIAYPIDSGDLLNMSTTQPDRNFVQADTWTASGSKSEMLDTFHDFNPRVRKLLELVPDGEVLEWKLRVHKPLPIWVTGQVALIGDACHPTLPHIAQGAAQAIEDAAALGVIFGKLQSKDEIPAALKVYQALRKPRADFAVMTAAENSKGLLTENKAARDASFDMAKSNGGNSVDKMISRDMNDIMYGYDVRQEADKQFGSLMATVSAAA